MQGGLFGDPVRSRCVKGMWVKQHRDPERPDGHAHGRLRTVSSPTGVYAGQSTSSRAGIRRIFNVCPRSQRVSPSEWAGSTPSTAVILRASV